MSALQFVEAVAVFQGAQGKFYLVNGQKYHIRFPMEWAHNHLEFLISRQYTAKTGPNHCPNCKSHGSIRGVFVGYCCNCVRHYIDANQPRGCCVGTGLPVYILANRDIWSKYPYMYGVNKSEIGDEEGAVATDEGIDLTNPNFLERIDEAIVYDIPDSDEDTVYDNNCDLVSICSDDATINL